ncbi:MAG: tetratricopeptide repeat protein, partial [Cyanobacteria bacterium J06638_6]
KNWARIKFALAFALALGLFLFHSLALPRIAVAYNQAGEDQFEAGDWASAQNSFEQAVSIRPDYPEAQFNLGVMYEEYQQVDQAQTEYLMAVQGGYLPAYNNLAHLYIQQGNPEDAVPLLRLALGNPALSQHAPELQYELHTNLGQVRLEQENLPEAATALIEAIEIGQSLDAPRPDAFCLLGHVLAQASPPAGSPLPTARAAWESCLQYATRPEDDRWENMARQALMNLETPENYTPDPAP